MKSFRTMLPPYQTPFALAHTDRLLLVGSCFTEHIGAYLAAAKFQMRVNPNGIVYNPVSIAATLQALQQEQADAEKLLFEHQGLWHSWAHHGRFSHPDREVALQNIETAHRETAAFFKNTNRLLLALGTADVFCLRETDQVVANNHKAPANWFWQRRLTIAETVNTLENALVQWHAGKPERNVLLTVSPVRHLRGGLVENQRSKAVLVLACAELCERLDFVHYFPAYELLLDDLRDYRFYAADMVHPTDTAVDYIWDYFAEAFFSSETRSLLAQIAKIRTAVAHRPFHPDTPEHHAFARQQLELIQKLTHQHPELDFSGEVAWFQQFCTQA
ncbi:MAG: GSCFA domain-containing protein [Lewinellaceae bacterium]|nr:GSCFA domain-containing protein [Lewinellaceae bacterium]